MNYKAFTMAEVLITLGILGVVIAMTLPALMSNHRKKIAEVRLAKFYSTINQAILRSELDNWPKEYWDKVPTGFVTGEDGNADKTQSLVTPWFNKYLKPYLFALNTEVEERTGEGKILVYFEDGSLLQISGSSFIFFPEAKDYDVVENESGSTTRDKTFSGTKYFTFFFAPYDKDNKYYYKKGVEPYMYNWDGTREMLLNGYYGCYQANKQERAYCAALIQMNGWTVPKDYPLRF